MRDARPAPREFDFDGEYGAGYEALAHALIPGYASTFELALALLRGRLGSDARVLVVGAGTGIEIVTLMRAEPGWRCTGVDPSRQMLDLAESRLEEAGIRGAELFCGFTSELEIDDPFDAATCFNVMHFLPDDGGKAGLLADVAARLRPGGSIIHFDLFGDPASPEHAEAYAAWRAFWTIRRMPAEDQAAFRAKLDAGIHWVSEARIRELLSEAGFEDPRPWYRSLVYGGWIATRSRRARGG